MSGKYQPKGWEKATDKSGGWFGGKHVQPAARDPRPKGAQRGVVRRDGQNKVVNTGGWRGIWR
jgi:hypothetical protein